MTRGHGCQPFGRKGGSGFIGQCQFLEVTDHGRWQVDVQLPALDTTDAETVLQAGRNVDE